MKICHSKFKCNYLKNKNLFLNFLFNFWNLHQISNILKQKMIVIANVFPKLQTVKNLLGSLSKKRRFRTRFDSRHAKASEILRISMTSLLICFFITLRNLIWKMSPLVLGEFLRVFVNTLTAGGKFPVEHCENLPLSIQMQLSEKQKNIFDFFYISGIYIKS